MNDLASVSNLKNFKVLIEKFKQLDIVTKELTLFDVGAHGHFENPTTELLSFFLDSSKSHGLGDCFFNGFLDIIKSKVLDNGLGVLISVETEVSTAKGNRIDLLIETKNALTIVECKIYHEQNNPFGDYTSYGIQRIADSRKEDEKDKNLIQIVLCLDGRVDDITRNNGWHGISYQELVEDIELHLSKALLDNPYNKWGLFAREFLLYLKGLGNMGKISKDEIDFLTENINNYFKLSEYLYESIIPKIANKIEVDLNSKLEGMYRKSKIKKWYDYEPYVNFSNECWKDSSSCVVLCIRNCEEKEISFTIHINFFNEFGISSDQVNNLLKEYEAGSRVYKDEADGNSIWRVMWKYNKFDIEQVSERIIELIKILNKYEKNKHQLSRRSII